MVCRNEELQSDYSLLENKIADLTYNQESAHANVTRSFPPLEVGSRYETIMHQALYDLIFIACIRVVEHAQRYRKCLQYFPGS